jgi:hypothetical protein
MKLVRLIKMCLNESYIKIHIGMSDISPIQNGLKQRDALSQLFFSFALECHYGGLGKPGGTEIKLNTRAAYKC